MKSSVVRVVLLVIGLMCARSAFAQQPLEASLSFVSDPGDYIGGGQAQTFTLDAAWITSRSGNDGGYFGLTVFPADGSFWFVDLAAPAGAQLTPGLYDAAARYPFQTPGQPGLSVSGDGRGCNTLTGSFEVLESRIGPNGFIERLHARFEQHCEGATAALRGELRVVNPPPPPALQITLSTTAAGRHERMGGRVVVSGTVVCTVPTTVGLNGALTQAVTRFALARATTYTNLPCSPTPTRWTMEFVPQGGVPFGNGLAELDVSASGYDGWYGQFVNATVRTAVRLQSGR